MTLRPLPDDPSGPSVEAMLDLGSDDWHYTAPGDYQTGAVYAMSADGDQGTLVALEIPARRHGQDETTVIRLLVDPEDAIGIAEVLRHTGAFLMARRAALS